MTEINDFFNGQLHPSSFFMVPYSDVMAPSLWPSLAAHTLIVMAVGGKGAWGIKYASDAT